MKEQKLTSPPCEVRVYDSVAELARGAAVDWLELVQVLAMAGQEPTVALSGGRVALTFFDAAAKVFRNYPEVVRKVQFFWGDERCVPPEHPESNYRAALKHLLKPLEVPEVNVHRIPGEFEPSLAAATAAKALARWTGADPGEVPCLDLVILGMGEDGHVASLFPEEPEDVQALPDICRAVTASKPPPQRVTVGYPVLAKAENVWVLASGSGKEEALHTAISEPGRIPLGRVLTARSNTRIYTDLSPRDGFGPSSPAAA
jgi:6-phosphogluconolactonase